MNTRILNG